MILWRGVCLDGFAALALARLHRRLLGCWHWWCVVGASLVIMSSLDPVHPAGEGGGCVVGLAVAICAAPLWCCAWVAWSSGHVVVLLCGPLGGPLSCRHRLGMIDTLQVHGWALVSALCRLRCKAPLMQTMWWGWRGVPSQGGVCQVPPSSCRSFEGFFFFFWK